MKKLAILAAAFALVLSVAAPSIAIAQEEPISGPAPKVGDATAPEDQYETTVVCSQQAVPQEEVTELPAANLNSDGDLCTDTDGTSQTGTVQNSDPACAQCGVQVAKAAQEAITGGYSNTGPSPTETFGAALQAARDAGGPATREADASEEAQQSPTPVEDTVTYQAAFEAAKEAGADDDTAREAAIEAVAEAAFEEAKEAGMDDEAAREVAASLLPGKAAGPGDPGESPTGGASKTSEVRTRVPGEKTATGEDKTREDRASKDDDTKAAGAKDKDRKDDASEEENANEEVTEDTDEEIVASGEEGGSGDAPTTPAGGRAPLLIGGVALLSVGGFAGLRLARSWSWVQGRRLLRN